MPRYITRKYYARFSDGASGGSANNIKLGELIATFSKLMGNEEHYIPEYALFVKGSCGEFCQYCDKHCYVRKSYVRHTNRETGECSVKKGHARNTLAFYEDLELSFKELDEQLKRKRKQYVFVRIDQSGELISEEEYSWWCWLARRHPKIQFYLYTKAYRYITALLLSGLVPENVTTLVSVWHECGIAEYKRVAHLDNVKAFAYMDKNKDPQNGWGYEEYAAHGLKVTVRCPAYDLKGKMNHNITCDHCCICMNRLATCKVIGCWAH